MTAPDPNRARVEAAAVRALRKLEWRLGKGAFEETICPSCGHSKTNGHDRHCELSRALAAADANPSQAGVDRAREIEELRAALVKITNTVGGYASDEVSTSFLTHVPAEVASVVTRLRAERDAAVATRDEAVAVVQSIEWGGLDENDHVCPACGGWKTVGPAAIKIGMKPGHARDCRIGKLLAGQDGRVER